MRFLLFISILISISLSLPSLAANKASKAESQAKTANSTTIKQEPIMQNQSNLSQKNLSDSKNFLDQNKKKPGIVTLPSGLQYKIEKEGTGSSPRASDFVTVHYRGTLINGTEFDSSYSRKEPTSFAVNAVIPGWTEALQLMKPGAKWMLYIPPNLAYGDRGVGRQIGPNSALIFEVELLSVKPSFDENQDGNVDEWEDID